MTQIQRGQQHGVVVAQHRIKPGRIQQIQRPGTVRAAIHQVTHAEQAIHIVVEGHMIHEPAQDIGVTVQITDDEIPALKIGRMGDDTRVHEIFSSSSIT